MSAPVSPLTAWLATTSFVLDQANGAPDGTSLRGTYVASVAARELGLDEDESAAAVVGALFRYLGCTSFAHEESAMLGDEHEAARLLAGHDKHDYLEIARVVATELGKHEPLGVRARRAAQLAVHGAAFQRDYEASHCEGAVLLATRLGVSPAVLALLGTLRERWDGAGGPAGLFGDRLARSTRIVQIARESVVHAVLGKCTGAALDSLARLGGGALDPAAADTLRSNDAFARSFDAEPLWELATAAIERGLERAFARPPSRDLLAAVLGDFADVKAPVFLGHSRAVASLAGRAAQLLGVAEGSLATLRRAGHLLDVGRVSVPNRIWDKPAPLDPMEWERVRMHVYYSERSCQGLDRDAATLVGQHHERADGSGYARGSRPDLLAAILGAADHAAALGAARPHRAAYSRHERARLLEVEVHAGRLHPDATAAVLSALGERPSEPPVALPGGLTERERDVLRRIARGLSNKEVAHELGISPRTVQAHTIHAYGKLGVHTRAGAALRAIELGLLQ